MRIISSFSLYRDGGDLVGSVEVLSRACIRRSIPVVCGVGIRYSHRRSSGTQLVLAALVRGIGYLVLAPVPAPRHHYRRDPLCFLRRDCFTAARLFGNGS